MQFKFLKTNAIISIFSNRQLKMTFKCLTLHKLRLFLGHHQRGLGSFVSSIVWLFSFFFLLWHSQIHTEDPKLNFYGLELFTKCLECSFLIHVGGDSNLTQSLSPPTSNINLKSENVREMCRNLFRFKNEISLKLKTLTKYSIKFCAIKPWLWFHIFVCPWLSSCQAWMRQGFPSIDKHGKVPDVYWRICRPQRVKLSLGDLDITAWHEKHLKNNCQFAIVDTLLLDTKLMKW